MLVLRRTLDERIVIGGNIEVVITEIGSNHVKIGIDAPRDVSVHRKEIQEAIDREKELSPVSLSS